MENSKIVDGLKSDISKVTSEFDIVKINYESEIEEHKHKAHLRKKECSSQMDEITALKAELADTKKKLDEKTHELEQKCSKNTETEEVLRNELDRTKRDLSGKVSESSFFFYSLTIVFLLNNQVTQVTVNLGL